MTKAAAMSETVCPEDVEVAVWALELERADVAEEEDVEEVADDDKRMVAGEVGAGCVEQGRLMKVLAKTVGS
eukprot:1470323-Ditylum_brightwellii.AAC.1